MRDTRCEAEWRGGMCSDGCRLTDMQIAASALKIAAKRWAREAGLTRLHHRRCGRHGVDCGLRRRERRGIGRKHEQSSAFLELAWGDNESLLLAGLGSAAH